MVMLFTAINTKLASALTGVALAAAVAAPAALAQQNVGSPDARDANNHYAPQLGQSAQNVGSPDARDANDHYAPQLGQSAQNVGSPGARDANNHYAPQLPVEQPVTDVPAAAPSGFDWVSAAIGAAAGTGVLIMLLASARSVAAVSRRIRVAR